MESLDEGWRQVDEGWGRQAVQFSTLFEPANCREYVALHHLLDLKAGERLLDVACGSGLAVELAALRGARCAGIDASMRLVAVAKDRSPQADLRVGDMQALPWDDGSFDVVTSFRGIWATTPGAVSEVFRVLAPGGRVGITVWGHIKASSGAWALAPLALAAAPQVEHQAAMVSLGRPGAGEALLEEFGFTGIKRVEIPFAWEFPDPEAYARALASTGPAFEAIQAIGEEAFIQSAIELARERVRQELPLRASIAVVGYIASKPDSTSRRASTGSVDSASPGSDFLGPVEHSGDVQRLVDGDIAGVGYVTNSTRLWAHQPGMLSGLSDLMDQAVSGGSLSYRQRCILVAATASSLGDSYCSLAWGKKLAGEVGDPVAAAVLRGDYDGLEPGERVLAHWARRVVTDPNGIGAEDVGELRVEGFKDPEILAITAYVALRLAFSTVNDALGARPDRQLEAGNPVSGAVTFGRPPSSEDSGLRMA